jgi:carbamoyl-phosphate synthase large subunit
MRDTLKKVLIVGSGPIKIAEAAEFDYSGSQALKAVREEGIQTVLVSSNVATIQTTYKMTDRLYMIPITWWAVEKVIEKERPDGIMVGFGGQTALNVGVDLWKNGVIQKYGIKVLGTPISGIERALSREKFRETMIEAGLPVPPSSSATSEEEAVKVAREIGYPVMVRVSFNLGGRGSTVAWTEEQLRRDVRRAFAQSYIGEVLIEKYLYHWKELEYEVMRDYKGNSAVIACIENLDPMGVHTGESTVISPCQTLDNYEYQEMRTRSMKVAQSIELIGECNVQFALNPYGRENYVIETNPRMSRSSALASKVTGYPLAYVAAKLALGYSLPEVINKVTGSTCACFEPSLDYVVIKVPRWDLQKFDRVENSVGTEMKSVGEVMSIARSFEEALQKAVRMLDIGEPGVVGGRIYESDMTKEKALEALKEKRPYWFLYAAKALKEGATPEDLWDAYGLDIFFGKKLKALVDFYEELKRTKRLDSDTLLKAKRLGFSDYQIAKAVGKGEEEIRKMRAEWKIEPKVKQIDTLAGEWPAVTNYLYLTYNAEEDDVEFSNRPDKVLVLGAGGFRIGVSVEFDWSTVLTKDALEKRYGEVMMLNYNPETVSTDWDVSRKLYFDEITVERIMDIYLKERPKYVVTYAGGQIGNSVAKKLEDLGVRLYGTAGHAVDNAEDREKFSKLLDRLGIKQPPWVSARSEEEVKKFVDEVGFPVLVRPSYVLSGSAMDVVYSYDELWNYIRRATDVSPQHPVVISKFIEDAIEAEVDAATDGKGAIGAVLEHVEEAGVHSGDATMSIPHRLLSEATVKEMKGIALTLARELSIKGPFNIQFVVKDGVPYVIELNLRVSRSMPFTSKTIGVNLMEKAVEAVEEGLKLDDFHQPKVTWWGVKSPQFSWAQLKGAYPSLGPEMRSTGEAASFGLTFYDALLKSWLSTAPNRMPNRDEYVIVYGRRNVTYLKEAYRILKEAGYVVKTVEGAEAGDEVISYKEAVSLVSARKVSLVITDGRMPEVDYELRRTAVDMNVPLVLNGRLGREIAEAIKRNEMSFLELRELGAGI